jgi:hypothetical protein
MQTMIDGLKGTNKKDGKVSYWNWNYAPMDNDATTSGGHQYLTKDFTFMPMNWGVGVANQDELREAGAVNFKDASGVDCPATMADVFLGANEPDIYGSCMGNMFGKCTAPCKSYEVPSDCPVAHLVGPQGSGQPNSQGRCDCWSDSHATGVGFWNVANVNSVWQPLPTCWDHADCVEVMMSNWKQTAAIAVAKQYKYLTAPLVAVDMKWMKQFIAKACDGCSDTWCGCPTHVGWHFYANDCQPEKGGYDSFQAKLDATVALMEEFPHLQGAIVNEVGMLNCAMDTPDAICVPDGPNQKYPASAQPDHSCPSTDALPNGLASFVEVLLQMVSKAKTADGRRAVVSFTWFNLNMAGGTYNLRMFNDDGTLNQLGASYISACQAWASGAPLTPPPPPPPPGPPTPVPPSPKASCNVGDTVVCPASTAHCAGNQCCPDGSTCPSASEDFQGCLPKKQDCVNLAAQGLVV